jgi:hypothetical protein
MDEFSAWSQPLPVGKFKFVGTGQTEPLVVLARTPLIACEINENTYLLWRCVLMRIFVVLVLRMTRYYTGTYAFGLREH